VQVTLHELGHALGLRHSQEKGAIMHPIYRRAEHRLALAEDDIAGIRALYHSTGMCTLFTAICARKKSARVLQGKTYSEPYKLVQTIGFYRLLHTSDLIRHTPVRSCTTYFTAFVMYSQPYLVLFVHNVLLLYKEILQEENNMYSMDIFSNRILFWQL
jgi:Matrixin